MLQRLITDTDTLSEIFKAVNQNVAAKARTYSQTFGTLDFTSASVFEILYGLNRKGAPAQIQRAEALFAKNNEIVPDAEDYRLAAEIAGVLDRQGAHIGLADPLIAACAIRRGYGIVTGNTNHFSYIRNAGYSLYLENWRNS